MKKIEIIGIDNIPEIKPNDNLPEIILEALEKSNIEIKDKDILVISQKIVSKSENRIIKLSNIIPSEEAINIARITGKDPRFIELVLRESVKVLKVKEGHIIVKTKQGIVCANAGIDKSNVEGEDYVVLLPEDPDFSAEKIRKYIENKTNKKIGVIISDTYGRPLREGQINLAIGCSGVKVFKDYRGKKDRYGYILRIKNIAIADEIASAAELVMGQADESIPVAIVRGLDILFEGEKGKDLNMEEEKWLFK